MNAVPVPVPTPRCFRKCRLPGVYPGNITLLSGHLPYTKAGYGYGMLMYPHLGYIMARAYRTYRSFGYEYECLTELTYRSAGYTGMNVVQNLQKLEECPGKYPGCCFCLHPIIDRTRKTSCNNSVYS